MTTSIGFYADRNTSVDLHDYGTERTPLLTIHQTGQSLIIGAHDTVPMADHLAFARQLADATYLYLCALEAFAASRPVDLTKAA